MTDDLSHETQMVCVRCRVLTTVWVGPHADDEEAVFANTRDATISALKLGAGGGPWHGHLTEVETPENPNFRNAGHGDNRPG